MDNIALEIERLERDIRALWRRLILGKKVSAVCAIAMFFLGLSSGATIHMILGAYALENLPYRVDHSFDEALKRRSALIDILIGALCTLGHILLLVNFTHYEASACYGFYITLLLGFGITLGGFLQFSKSK